jgi:hypothetical protein
VTAVPAAGTWLARAALALYPPSWRERYAAEVEALIEDSGGSIGAAASLAARAIPVWLDPPRQLHDHDGRMRASLATVLAAWSALTGIALVFVQLTQLQGFAPATHPVVGWSYAVFDVALASSLVIAVAGGLPLWWQMLRQARRERCRRAAAALTLAVAAPAAVVAAAAIALKVVHHPEGSGPWWFVTFAVIGFVAAGIAAGGPITALRALRPAGPAVRRATMAAALAASTVILAGLASAVAATGLCLWSPGFAGYHHAAVLDAYLVVVAGMAVTAGVSAVRGIRARLAPATDFPRLSGRSPSGQTGRRGQDAAAAGAEPGSGVVSRYRTS